MDQQGSATMSDKTKNRPWTDVEIEKALVDYFSGEHWAGFIQGLEAGPHVRHAHVYNDGLLHPSCIARFLTFYFARFQRPLLRKIKILPLAEDFMNVYNVQPKGQCHWEFFLNYTPGVLLRPAEKFNARATHAVEFWDDEYMENFYRRFSFKSIGQSELADTDTYFNSFGWKRNLLINIDEFGDVIHTHALIESSLHPEELVKVGQNHLEKIGWKIERGISVVFNNFGWEIGKLTYLVSKPEVVIEIEWHYNPKVTIKEGAVPYFRVSSAEKRRALLGSREYVEFGQDMVERVIDRLVYPA